MAAVSQDYSLLEIKQKAKEFGVSINDMVTTILSMTLKQYFSLKNDTETSKVMFIMPYSMRTPPKDPKVFNFNNEFVTVPVEMRLVSEFRSGLKIISKDLAKIKGSFMFMGIYYMT